jgi:hypothetical protein
MATVNIPSPLLPAGSISFTSPFCNGQQNGSASIIATGVGPFTYSWNPGGAITASIGGLGAGIYTCTIKDTYSCTTQKTVNVTQPATIIFTCSVSNETCAGCCNGSLTFSVNGGTGPYDFTVNPGAITGTNTFLGNLCAGTYTALISDANACPASLTATVLSVPNGIFENKVNGNGISIQFTGAQIIFVNDGKNRMDCSVYDVNGKLAGKCDVAGENFCPVTKPEKGIYLLHFRAENGNVTVKKIIVD